MSKITLSILVLLLSLGIDNSSISAQDTNPLMVIQCRYAQPNNNEGGESFNSGNTKNNSKTIICPDGNPGDPIMIPNAAMDECIPKCFNGEVTAEFAPLDCSLAPTGDLLVTQLCFSSADPNNPLQVGQHVTVEEIYGCFDPNGAEWYEILIEQLQASGQGLTSDKNTGFAPAVVMNGVVQVCATFYIDPSNPEVFYDRFNAVSGEFEEFEEDACANPPAPAAIPTLNQWGLLILGLLTSCLALGFMLKRKHSAA